MVLVSWYYDFLVCRPIPRNALKQSLGIVSSCYYSH